MSLRIMNTQSAAHATQAPSLTGPLLNALGMLVALLLLAMFGFRADLPFHPDPVSEPSPPAVEVAAPEPEPEPAPPAEPLPVATPSPVVKELDHAAVAAAQEVLDSATRDRMRAEDRVKQATADLTSAQLTLSQEMATYRNLVKQVRDPSARIERAQGQMKLVMSEVAKLKTELVAIEKAPRPKGKALLDKSPVARPPAGAETHFEIRANRVSYLDIEGLLDRLKTDARVQLRMMSAPRPINGTVGPVGAFSIRYEMVPAGLALGGGGGRSSALSASYDLNSWEIVPVQNLRGESYEQAISPASDFAQATARLDPQRDAITLWVYPDGFELYRVLRDQLHQRGFLISARPLPEDMLIRGSPSGSISAAQ